MNLGSARIRVALLLGGAAILAGCGFGGGASAPTATPTKTPKPTYTATAAATATFTATPLPTATMTPEVPPTDTPSPTPEVPPTETNTPTPEATNTPSVPPTPTNTPGPPPPTNTPAPPPTPTPMPFQYTGQLIWDEGSANCAAASIRKESTIRDTAGSPIDGVCVCYQVWDFRSAPSVPSGVPGVYDPGHYDIYPVRPQPEDVEVQVYICDCATGQQNANSQVVTVDFNSQNCGPGQGGHQAAIVNWTKHW